MDKHKEISFIKSELRILGFIVLFIHSGAGVGILLGAEILGILEEL